MKSSFLFTVMLMLLSSAGCSSGLKNDIADMIDKTFVCETQSYEKFGEEPSRNSRQISEYKFTFIAYFDSIECMECHINKLNNWNKFIQICEDNDTRVLFLFNPKRGDIMNLKMNIMRQRFKYPVYIDTCGSVKKHNNWIPKNPICHTFLLNDKNKVIMVGDPRKNISIMNLFNSMVKN